MRFLLKSMGVVVAVMAMSSSVAFAVTYSSCKDAKDNGENTSGTYDIQGLGSAYCDMQTNGGGWLGVTPQMARSLFNGTLNITDGSSNTSTGFDADRPYTVDGTGAHTAQYTFRLPFVVKEFFFKDYRAKSNAATSDSSDIYPSRFRQSVWGDAHEQSVGDISFGFANESGPVTSFARELASDKLYATGDLAPWPSPAERYVAQGSGDDDFRIAWGDEGVPSEGWFPWWGGMLMLREAGNYTIQQLRPVITLPTHEANITDKTPVISGRGTRRDTIITVSGPNAQYCNAVVDSSLRWTCVLYPSLSVGRQRLCAVEREGSLQSSQVCIYVNINNPTVPNTPIPQVGQVTVISPTNGITITTNNPPIIGTGVPGNRIVVNAVGNNCSATVLPSGGWTCTLVNLNPGTYSVTASQYMPTGAPNGNAVGSFVINTPIVIPPTNGGLCSQHITSYMKMGQYNDQSQVRKLQEYLNSREGARLAVTGVFDFTTEAAVKRYQQKYAQDILQPWGMQAPSGYVFKTTINHINRQLCSGQIQCPVFTRYHKLGESGGEIGKIQNFLKQYGYYNRGVTGYFDRATDVGIRAFQEEFRPMILTPWNLPQPTGNWYKTSRKHANWLNGCYERVTLEGVGVTF